MRDGMGCPKKPRLRGQRAAEAVRTPSSEVEMSRVGEAPLCRSQARKGAQDKGRVTEEPCEGQRSRTGLKQRRGE
jgi:hypothetical protein